MADSNPFRRAAPAAGDANPFRRAAPAAEPSRVTLDELFAKRPPISRQDIDRAQEQMGAMIDPRMTGAVAQGVTLGAADEVIGGAAGLVTGRGYQAGVDLARQDNAEFAEEHPAASAAG